MRVGRENGDCSDLSDRLAHENSRQRRSTGEVAREEPFVPAEAPDTSRRDTRAQIENFIDEEERWTVRQKIFGPRQRRHFPIAFKRLAGVSLGEILYQTSCSFPFASTRKADLSMPMYLRPYMLFSFHTP